MMHFAARKRAFKGWTEDQRRNLLAKLVGAIKRANAIPIGSVVMLRGRGRASRKRPEDLPRLALSGLPRSDLPHRGGRKYDGPTWVWTWTGDDGLCASPRALSRLVQYGKPLGSVAEIQRDGCHDDAVLRFRGSNDCTPLQAADLWAYELGHHFERIRPDERPARWAFREFVRWA